MYAWRLSFMWFPLPFIRAFSPHNTLSVSLQLLCLMMIKMNKVNFISMVGQCVYSTVKVCAHVNYYLGINFNHYTEGQMPPRSGQACGMPRALSPTRMDQETSDKSRKRKPGDIKHSISMSKKKKTTDSETEVVPIQEWACIEYALDSELLCVSCSGFENPSKSRSLSALREKCRFIGFRRLEVEEDNFFTSFNETGVLQHRFDYFTWKPMRNTYHIELVKVWLQVTVLWFCFLPPL